MQETWVWSLGGKDPPREGHGNPLQYSYLKNPHEQRSLADYSPWGRKESEMTEWLNMHTEVDKLKKERDVQSKKMDKEYEKDISQEGKYK